MPDDTDDFVPPKKIFLDDYPVVDPELGPVPLWKSILWTTANLRRVMARADSAAALNADSVAAASVEFEESKPPAPVATPDDAEEERKAKLTADIIAAVDALEARMSALEATRAERLALDMANAQAPVPLQPEPQDEAAEVIPPPTTPPLLN
jgi:hypothetical protein